MISSESRIGEKSLMRWSKFALVIHLGQLCESHRSMRSSDASTSFLLNFYDMLVRYNDDELMANKPHGCGFAHFVNRCFSRLLFSSWYWFLKEKSHALIVLWSVSDREKKNDGFKKGFL